jgi:polyisoprenoid-binding protein YceI
MISIKNNKWILAGLFCIAITFSANAQTYVGKNIKVGIFSSTPVEDIKAVSNTGIAVLAKQEIAVQVAIKSLEFDKKLMQEHFNENYMESDKFPNAKFKGIIDQKIDYTKDGEYMVTAKGILNVHGVDQARTINGKIAIKSGAVSLYATFDVACKSHGIKIPTIVFAKIAEVIKVTINGTLTPLNK